MTNEVLLELAQVFGVLPSDSGLKLPWYLCVWVSSLSFLILTKKKKAEKIPSEHKLCTKKEKKIDVMLWAFVLSTIIALSFLGLSFHANFLQVIFINPQTSWMNE